MRLSGMFSMTANNARRVSKKAYQTIRPRATHLLLDIAIYCVPICLLTWYFGLIEGTTERILMSLLVAMAPVSELLTEPRPLKSRSDLFWFTLVIGLVSLLATRDRFDVSALASNSAVARIHRWTGMDGVRTVEGGEGVTGAMIRARIWVDGRLAGGLQALWGAPMAAYSGCGERDGGIGHGKRRLWTGLARVCGDVGLVAGGSVAGGRGSALFCTWLQWLPADSTPSYGISTSDS